MRDLASYIMQGPKQAAIVAFVSTLIPMFFWVGAATVGLVVLRHGLTQGFTVFVWAVIPALGWWLGMQDPGALFVLILALVMAGALRNTVSWQSTMLSGGLVSILLGVLAPHVMPELIDTLMAIVDDVFQELAAKNQIEYDENAQGQFRSLLIASFAATFYVMALTALFLSRSWQSMLYNPGGWQQEFHQMRLSPMFVLGLFVSMALAPLVGLDASLIFFIATIPVMMCGIALVHGVIGKKKLGGHWLVGFYLSIFLLFPTVLILVTLLACLDSALDIRSRMTDVQNREQ